MADNDGITAPPRVAPSLRHTPYPPRVAPHPPPPLSVHARITAMRDYVRTRGFVDTPNAPYRLRHVTRMTQHDWVSVVNLLLHFRDLTPAVLAQRGAIDLLDYSNAWQVLGLEPAAFAECAAPHLVSLLARRGVYTAAHAAWVWRAPLTPHEAAIVPLEVLAGAARALPSRPRDAARETLRRALNADAAARAATEKATATDGVLTIPVTHGHLPLLRSLYPRAPPTLSDMNAWLAPLAVRFKLVPLYAAPPPLPRAPFGPTTVWAPLALERLWNKYVCDERNKEGDFSAANVGRRAALLERAVVHPTFTLPDAVLDTPQRVEDAYMTPWDALPEDGVVCWGTLAQHDYLSCTELDEWLRQADALTVFGHDDAAYTPQQIHALQAVLRVLAQRRAPSPPSPCLTALRARVDTLVARAAIAATIAREGAEMLTALPPHERALLAAFYTAVQRLAAYCLHWGGDGTPWPRIGDTIVHLEDTQDVEERVYTLGVPPVIDALAALPAAVARAACAMPQFVSRRAVNDGITVQRALHALQAPVMERKVCIRLSARPLWHTAVNYAAMFCGVALPQYEARAPTEPPAPPAPPAPGV